MKFSALDLLLSSLKFSPHFRPLSLIVTAAKTRIISKAWVEDRGLGTELTLSWVGTATSFQPTILRQYPYLATGISTYISAGLRNRYHCQGSFSSHEVWYMTVQVQK